MGVFAALGQKLQVLSQKAQQTLVEKWKRRNMQLIHVSLSTDRAIKILA